MKHLIVLLLAMTLLSACKGAADPAEVVLAPVIETQPPAGGGPVNDPSAAEPTAVTPSATQAPEPEPTHAAPESALYRDEQAGFELDYPLGWMLEASTEVGARGSQGTLTSWQHIPGDIVTDRPGGSTLIALTVYQWDPKNDLTAYITQRKTAWEASGFIIVSEESVTLSGLQPAQLFVIETPEKFRSFVLFTNVGEDYLQISGDGDLDLVRQVALTLRVYSR